MAKQKLISMAAAGLLVALIVLPFPAVAFAEVRIDDTAINQGENAVGGGVATLADSVLDMVNVVANTMTVDENLTINFNGGNDIKEEVTVSGSAEVTANFTGENDVEDFEVRDDANLTLNADGHNSFEEINAYDNAAVTINVTGENDFEEIYGKDNASITVRGTDCQKKDVVNLEDDETGIMAVENGNLTVDHVTLNLKGSEINMVGSFNGDTVIDTSKIEAEDSSWTQIIGGDSLNIRESVIDITGEVFSNGTLTIDHSDVEVGKPEAVNDKLEYRIFSYEGVKLINEENGKVLEGEVNGKKVWYVDTDDNDGSDVDLEADGDPEYYTCKSSDSDSDSDKAPERSLPKTADTTPAPIFAIVAILSATTLAYARRRRWDNVA